MADGGDEHALLLQISYDLNRLQKQSSQAAGIVDKGLSAIEARAKRTALELEASLSLKNVNPGAALTNALSGLKTGVLDEASSKLGVFGGALGALGPIGLAAGAAVAGFGFAVSNSLKTAAWAEDLKRASDTLGLTTTQLQEFDFVFQSMGIDVARGRETLAGLAKTIGLVMEGAARKMQLQQFTEVLKITPDQLRGWGTLENQLPHILDSLAKLDPEERAATAQRLKVDPEVITSLVEERDRIHDLIDELHKYGIVIGPDLIEKSAEAEGKIRALSTVMQGELRVAFIDIAPLLVGIAKNFADAANGLTDFTKGVKDILTPLGDLIDGLKKLTGFSGIDIRKIGPFGWIQQGIDAISAQGARDREMQAASGAARDLIASHIPPKTSPHSFMSSGGRKAHKPEDRNDDALSEADDKLLSATKDELEARLSGVKDAAQRAAIQSQLLDIELKIKDSEYAKLQASLDEELAKKQITKATHDRASAELRQAQLIEGAADAERRIIEQQTAAQEAAMKKLQNDNALADIRAQGNLDMLRAEQGVWQTAENRRKLALQIFATEEQIAEDKLKQQIAEAQLAKDAAKEAEARQQLANLQATKGLRQQAVSDANPANAWDSWVQSARQATSDVSASFAQMKVDAIDAFNNSLFDSEGRLNSFGAIARSVAASFIKDFEQFSLKSIEAGIFGGSEGQGGNPLTNFFGGLFGKGGGAQQAAATNSATGALGPFTNAVQLATTALQQLAGGSGSSGAGGIFGQLFGGGGSGGGLFGGLGSLFGGGGAAAGNTANELLSGLEMGAVPFADGGQFTVGGAGGIDKNLVAFRATAGERVTVETPQQQLSRGQGGFGNHVSQTFVFPGADPNSFKQTQRQWARQSKQAMQFA